MIIIRLVRYGRKRVPFYNIVIADRRRCCSGKFIKKIGYYNPFCVFENYKSIYIDIKLLNIWLKEGALMSKRVLYLVNKYKKKYIC